VKLKIKALLNTKPQQQHSQLHLIDLPESEGGEKKREHEEKAKNWAERSTERKEVDRHAENRRKKKGKRGLVRLRPRHTVSSKETVKESIENGGRRGTGKIKQVHLHHLSSCGSDTGSLWKESV